MKTGKAGVNNPPQIRKLWTASGNLRNMASIELRHIAIGDERSDTASVEPLILASVDFKLVPQLLH